MSCLLHSIVQEKLKDVDPDSLEPFLSTLLERVWDRCEAVLVYGSCLSTLTRTESSTPDFYIVVKKYRKFYASGFHAFLNYLLPPNIYHFSIDDRIAKYNVIRLSQLQKETSDFASDIYHLGRFSKRLALVWVRNSEIKEEIAKIQAQAMQTVAKKIYALLPPFFLRDEFIKKALKLSYEGDVRIEAEDKIEKLFEAEKIFYTQAYQEILNGFCKLGALKQSPGTEEFQKAKHSTAFPSEMKTRYFLFKSRIRSQVRWPKGMFTVENWIDYLFKKLERTKGVRVEMPEYQKRFWFIYGWKYFFRFRKFIK